MSLKLLQGHLNLILLSILEDGEKYGLEIIEFANARTDGYFRFKEGSLYPALHRLEKAGFLAARFVHEGSGGPRRRYYRLTASGAAHLLEQRQQWRQFNAAVELLVDGT